MLIMNCGVYIPKQSVQTPFLHVPFTGFFVFVGAKWSNTFFAVFLRPGYSILRVYFQSCNGIPVRSVNPGHPLYNFFSLA